MALFKRKKKEDKDAVKTLSKTKEEKERKDNIKVDSGKREDQVKTNGKSAGKSMKELYSETGKEVIVTSKDGKKVKKQKKYGNAYKILAKPLVTEKAANLGAHNQYVFEVAPKANKIEIAKAINEVYGIKPVSVNIVKMKGKKVNYGRHRGRRRDWKKAIVKLPEGKTINIYEGV